MTHSSINSIRAFLLSVILLLVSEPLSYGNEIVVNGNNYKIPKIYEENGTPKGILVDIMTYLDDRLVDYSFKIELYPWARAYKNAENAKGGIIGLSKTNERLKIFDYSDVVFSDKVIIVVMKEKEFHYDSIDDLKGKRIGIGRGGSFGDDFDTHKQMGMFKVVEDNGPVHRLMHLVHRKIDVALISPGRAALERTINQHPRLNGYKDLFTVLPKAFKNDPNYLGFSKKLHMKGFLEQFNKALEEGYRNGEIPRIISAYE